MNLAPIILFVYNRPIHTLQTLISLQQNHLSNQSLLYIFADAPKENASEDDLRAIAEVKKIIWTQQWCQEIRLIERKQNFGLAKNIIEGVSQVVQQYGKVIVLEDDIVTSSGFLTYMNQALELYEQEEEVMHISGHFPSVDIGYTTEDTFFYKKTSCWGWGTWATAWAKLNTDARYLLDKINAAGRVAEFNIEDSYNFIEHLEANIAGRINTWAIKWQSSVFLENGLCLYPKQSLTRNIGFDNTGEHCVYSEEHLTQKIAEVIMVEKIDLRESSKIRKQIARFNHKQAQADSLLKRIKNKINKYIKHSSK